MTFDKGQSCVNFTAECFCSLPGGGIVQELTITVSSTCQHEEEPIVSHVAFALLRQHRKHHAVVGILYK